MMNQYLGIDLGTTNSAICSFDGVTTRVWKSREQNDVTPSALAVSSRGSIRVGQGPYDNAPRMPDHTAMLFKRLMGTSTPVRLPGVNRTLMPEECSAEVLRELYGYLKAADGAADRVSGTVITVPAAFNTMQKEATKKAAEMAGIGAVVLMQEPVAAAMSVMKKRDLDGTFLIYDLGGGTLDVTVATSIKKRIDIIATGGIQMCGGRDWDRAIVDNVVKPWLDENFDLPADWSGSPSYKGLARHAARAAEKAKIELSAKTEATIHADDMEIGLKDEAGAPIYLDIPLDRAALDRLIASRIAASVEAARETLDKAGLEADAIEEIVFVGGPTHYRSLRDTVKRELAIESETDVNPMTAVAEGAAIFAESVDWDSAQHAPKPTRGEVVSTGPVNVVFKYVSRTPNTARLDARVTGKIEPGTRFKVEGLEDGWVSGWVDLVDGASLDVPLSVQGENRFRITILNGGLGAVSLDKSVISITKTASVVEAIPASHSVGIVVLTSIGSDVESVSWLVRAGDGLPKSGRKVFKSGTALGAGSRSVLNFKVVEGESETAADNRVVGNMVVRGTDLVEGTILAGAELVCDYEMGASGCVRLEVSVPCVGATFQSGRNFYSPQAGQRDFSSSSADVAQEGISALQDLDDLEELVGDGDKGACRPPEPSGCASPAGRRVRPGGGSGSGGGDRARTFAAVPHP